MKHLDERGDRGRHPAAAAQAICGSSVHHGGDLVRGLAASLRQRGLLRSVIELRVSIVVAPSEADESPNAGKPITFTDPG